MGITADTGRVPRLEVAPYHPRGPLPSLANMGPTAAWVSSTRESSATVAAVDDDRAHGARERERPSGFRSHPPHASCN